MIKMLSLIISSAFLLLSFNSQSSTTPVFAAASASLHLSDITAYQSNTHLSLKTFAKLPLAKDIQLSPDGKHIAYLRDVSEEYIIVVQSLVNPKSKPRTLKIGDAQMRKFEWLSNDRLLFTATTTHYSRGDFETFTMQRAGIMNTENGEVYWPFSSSEFTNNISGPQLVNKLAADEDHILMSYYYRQKAKIASYEQHRTAKKEAKIVNAVFKINIDNGKREKVFTGFNASDWISDQSGNIQLFRQDSTSNNATLNMFKGPRDDDFKALKTVDAEGKDSDFTHHVIGLTEDAKRIYFTARNDGDLYTLYQADINKGYVENETNLSKNTKYDLNYVVTDYLTSELLGFSIIKDVNEYTYLDKKLAQAQADLSATFPGAQVSINSFNKARTKFAVFVSSFEYPEHYFLYDTETGSLGFLGQGFALAENKTTNAVKRFTYTASDGLELSGYLTLPASSTQATETKAKPPLIVLVHGGPASRDDMRFDWQRQFFAAQGFAVFQANFRGSEGFGYKFESSGHGQWGKKMQSDVDEGVAALIEQAIVDDSKICIVGSSYGGYAALYGATGNPSLYKCAVSFAGVSELGNMFYHVQEQKGLVDYWIKSIGARFDEDELRAHSPLFMANKESSPILMMHGSDDTVVPSFQSAKMFKRLQELGLDSSQYIEIEGGDHWFSTGKTRRIFLKNANEFINKHIH
ncbi:S9 family peptidase [Glaciecola sp. MH2013]|uniref:alpha/beta hydrolase family protein n=1 Tax=Glaciecola sp. MH2013 TaxID=2785524 RepID=UPI00189FAFAB|nr:alpha/beta fold hydrolase [Glaciecola sp. MH2013]MBF7072345.1 S9 family peptidase [Glaciecola sp. MH2013]